MSESEAKHKVDIHYLKSQSFREVMCDGALGGPTPKGNLWIAFYSERFPLPRVVNHQLVPTDEGDGFMLDPNEPGSVVEARRGLIRNVEFGAYLSLDVATELYGWLGEKIEELKQSGGK